MGDFGLRLFRRFFGVPAGLFFVLFVGLIDGQFALAIPDNPTADEIIHDIHDNLADMSQRIGGLSKDQQASEDALEKVLATKIRAGNEAEFPSKEQIIAEFRAILNDAQKKKLDQMIASSRAQIVGMIISHIHQTLTRLSRQVGDLSPEQRTKENALEESLAAKVRSSGKSVFDSDVAAQFRAILDDTQKAKLDRALARRADELANLHKSGNLRMMFMAIGDYATTHDNAMPPDLGSMVSKDAPPDMFLAADSKVATPKDIGYWDLAKQAAWVKEHSDFAYVGASAKFGKIDPGYVIAYVRTVGLNRYFLFGDASVRQFDEKESTKIIADLNAGKNPPPSLSK